jgi:membrane-associated protease RseP (regulator of RpoE activity)
MKRNAIFFATAVALAAGFRWSAFATSERPLVLPAVRVIADLLTLHSVEKAPDIIDYVVIEEVTPNTKVARSGLRAGDKLIAIDGLPIKGMKRNVYQGYLGEPVEPERPKTFTLLCKRGILGFQKIKIDLTFSKTG